MPACIDILLVEPFFTGSHAAWAEEFQRFSRHRVKILKLSGRFWKWRMHGGAVTLARRFLESDFEPDLILASDMLDLTTFLALTRHRTERTLSAVYFHENQLVYPWSPQDRDVEKLRDYHYCFINYATALAADRVFFNSKFHCDVFLESLRKFLKRFPDNRELSSVSLITENSYQLPLGMNLSRLDAYRVPKSPEQKPLLLWNHRWEHDKNPKEFFDALYRLKAENIDFQVAVLGERYHRVPRNFKRAEQVLKDNIVIFGYVKDFSEYAKWLWKADILPVTSYQDFFGASVVQAIYCQTWPLLPNRLAYPEHIPKSCAKRHLYGESEFYQKLKEAIMKINEIRHIDTQKYVNKYDWSSLIEEYDDAMCEVLEHRNSR